MKTIAKAEVKELVDSKADILLIDVREPFEFEEGNIETSINIPLMQIPLYLDTADKSKKIVFYCRTGNRSEQATEFAEKQGFDATNYEGSYEDWSQ